MSFPHPPAPSLDYPPSFYQAKLRQKRRKETRLELERVRALEEKAEVQLVSSDWQLESHMVGVETT